MNAQRRYSSVILSILKQLSRTTICNYRRVPTALLLIGVNCIGAVNAQELTLSAINHRVQDVHTIYEDGACENFAPGFTLNSDGLSGPDSFIIETWKAAITDYGQFPVGYRNHKKQGSDPFPCNKWNLSAVQFAFSFDLQSVPEEARITEAQLSWMYPPFDDSLLVPGFALNRPHKQCFGEGFDIGFVSVPFTPGRVSRHVPATCSTGCTEDGVARARAQLPFSLFVTVPFPADVREESESGVRFQRDISMLTSDSLHTFIDFNGFVMTPRSPPALVEKVWEETSRRDKFHHCVKLVSDVQLHLRYEY